MSLILIFVVVIFVYSLVSARLERTILTAPIVFTTAGILSFLIYVPSGGDGGKHYFLMVAEIGLVLLLFSDAFRTDLNVLRGFQNLPVRLLSIGMLLTILLGMAAAVVIFPGLSIWEAGILAAILAPTDAGLGQIIVNSQKLPLKIRQSLNVEAGLNDGLSVPFLLFFIALASGAAAGGTNSSLAKFIIEQLGYGALIGIGIGFVGGRLMRFAHDRETAGHVWSQLGLLALPILCILASNGAGASMFIAAFVGGMAARVGLGAEAKYEGTVEFTEESGQVFNLSIFFLFGLIVAGAIQELSARHVIYALVSLTVVRMLPVAISLIGTRLKTSTILFMGWFGPRGLASIVLGLVYLEHETHQPGEATIRLAVIATVLISIFAHGMSAVPGINIYAGQLNSLPAESAEFTTGPAEPLQPATT